MAYEMKEGDISIFKNDQKTPGSNQPDMRGKMMVDGKIRKISMWAKGEGDRRFLSGKHEIDTYVAPAPTPSAPTPVAPPPPAPVGLPPSENIGDPLRDTSDDLPF